MGLHCRAVFVDNVTYRFDHSHRMVVLPDIPSQIHPYGALLKAVVHKLEYLKLRVHLRPTGHNDRDRAASYDLFEAVCTPVCFHYPRPQLSGNAAAQTKVTGVSCLQLSTNRRNGHHGNAVSLTFINELR